MVPTYGWKKNWEKFANLPSNERPLLFNLGSCQVIVQSSCSVVSNSLPPHGLQHSRLPCPSPTPGACSNTCPSWWGHPTISSCYPLLLPSIIPSIKVFSNGSVLCNRWPKYCSFSYSISPSSEYSGLISFTIDWFDHLAVQELSKVFSSTTVQKHQFFSAQLSL